MKVKKSKKAGKIRLLIRGDHITTTEISAVLEILHASYGLANLDLIGNVVPQHLGSLRDSFSELVARREHIYSLIARLFPAPSLPISTYEYEWLECYLHNFRKWVDVSLTGETRDRYSFLLRQYLDLLPDRGRHKGIKFDTWPAHMLTLRDMNVFESRKFLTSTFVEWLNAECGNKVSIIERASSRKSLVLVISMMIIWEFQKQPLLKDVLLLTSQNVIAFFSRRRDFRTARKLRVPEIPPNLKSVIREFSDVKISIKDSELNVILSRRRRRRKRKKV